LNPRVSGAVFSEPCRGGAENFLFRPALAKAAERGILFQMKRHACFFIICPEGSVSFGPRFAQIQNKQVSRG
jgi:hypothetical protein